MTYTKLLRGLVFVAGLVSFLSRVSAQNPALQLSGTSLTFNAIAGGLKPPLQAVTVTSVTSSAIDFALLVDGGSPGTPAPAWLTVTPLLATTPAQIRVAADQTGLAAGTYSGRIQLTDRQGRTLGVIIPVTLQLNNGPAQFDVTPPALTFSGSVVQGNLQQGILLRNLGSTSLAPVSVNVVSGYPWLSTVVGSCDIVCSISVRAAISSLSPGAHTGLLRITTAAGSKDVPVSLYAGDHGPFDQLTPSALVFEAVQASGLGTSQNVTLMNNGDMLSTWSIDVLSGSQWLSVSPSSGTTAPGKSTTFAATMNVGNVSPGTYGGMLRVSSSDTGFTPIYLPVTLKVSISGTAPTPLLSTGGVFFTTPAGNPDSIQQQITLLAASPAPVNFQAWPQSSSWLSLVPARGQASSTPTPLTITAAGANQAVGFYSGLINIGFGTTSVRTLHAGFSVTATQGASCQPQNLHLTEIAVPDGFVVRAGSPTPLEVVLVDDCGNAISNGLVTATFSNGDPGVDLPSIGNGYYAQTWIPTNASDSFPGGNLSVAIQAYAPSLFSVSTEVVGAVTKDALPAIASGGVLNSFFPPLGLPVAPGAVVQIFGSALAQTTASGTVTNGLVSTTVGGVSLKIGGIDAPLFYVSPNQINAQVPSELQPNRQYQAMVNVNGTYSAPEPINTISAQPIIATFQDGKVIAQDPSYNLITADHPAHPGDIIILYLSGMGATTPPVPTGMLSPSSPPAVTAVQPQVSIDGAPAAVMFSGLSPGSVGLYQIDVQIPGGARNGDLPLVVSQGNITSNTAIVPVR